MDRLVAAYDAGNGGAGVSERGAGGARGASGAKKGALESSRAAQSAPVQSATGAAFRLSCAEIRRVFWQLVLLIARSAEAVLGWSNWRRRHQAEAHRHHYRRRAARTPAPLPASARQPPPPAEPATPAPDTLVEEVWRQLQPCLPTGRRPGRPYTQDRRVIVAAIVHQMRTGCAWNALPKHFPPYPTVHTQLREWQKNGVWAKIWEGVQQPSPG